MKQSVQELRQQIITLINCLPREQLVAIADYTMATTKQLIREVDAATKELERHLEEGE